MLNWVLNIVIIVSAVVVLVGVIRNRRITYHDIEASEVNPEVAAGEELLRDVLNEQHLRQAQRQGVRDA